MHSHTTYCISDVGGVFFVLFDVLSNNGKEVTFTVAYSELDPSYILHVCRWLEEGMCGSCVYSLYLTVFTKDVSSV